MKNPRSEQLILVIVSELNQRTAQNLNHGEPEPESGVSCLAISGTVADLGGAEGLAFVA